MQVEMRPGIGAGAPPYMTIDMHPGIRPRAKTWIGGGERLFMSIWRGSRDRGGLRGRLMYVWARN
jgi:hypothetical protein